MLTYSPSEDPASTSRIAVIGLGGAGSNVLHLMEKKELPHCSLYSVNLDLRLLEASGAPHKIHLGSSVTHGLGSGGDPRVGAQAAKESEASLVRALEGCSLVVMIAGLGGGTGSGAAPVIARLAKELGVLLVAVVTMPFDFEGARRLDQARTALAELALYADILIPFDNEKMASLVSEDGSVLRSFEASNRLLMRAAESVPMLSGSPGLIHLGLDDLRTVMAGRNRSCLFGFGAVRGGNKAVEAARQVMESPFLAGADAFRGVSEVLVHLSGGELLSLDDVRKTMDEMAGLLPGRIQIHFGVSVCPELGDELRIVFFASTALKENARVPAPVVEDVPVVLPVETAPESPVLPVPVQEEEKHEQEPPVPEPVIIHSDIDPGTDEPVPSDTEEPVPVPEPEPEDKMPVFSFSPTSRIMKPSTGITQSRSRKEAVLPRKEVPPPPPEEEDPFDRIKEIFADKEPSGLSTNDEKDSQHGLPDESNILAEEEDEDGKGLFSNVDAFIVDGEDLDLPPFMRKKK